MVSKVEKSIRVLALSGLGRGTNLSSEDFEVEAVFCTVASENSRISSWALAIGAANNRAAFTEITMDFAVSFILHTRKIDRNNKLNYR